MTDTPFPTARTIELCLDQETLTTLGLASDPQKLTQAIGYFSSWNLSLHYVRITGGVYSGNPELTATYWKRSPHVNEGIAYQIGAVWHGDHFGFHS